MARSSKPSATRNVLLVPEIVREVLAFLSEDSEWDLRSCLYVCKVWSEETLSIHWASVCHPEELFGLLMPMKKRKDGQHYFARSLKQANWGCFSQYARRVKHLSLFTDDLTAAAYAAIARYKPTNKPLLPNLERLSCFCNPDVFDLFAHTNITSLYTFNSENARKDLEHPDRINDFFSELPDKVPYLRSLSITISQEGPFDAIEDAVVQFVGSLKCLRSIILTPTWISPRVTEALSGHPHLRVLDAFDEYGSITDATPKTPLFSHALSPDSFCSLTSLSITMTFARAVECFASGRCTFDKVVELKMESKYFDTARAYSRLLEVVPQVFPALVELDLDSNPERFPKDTPKSTISFEDLRPLLGLQSLTHLTLTYTHPFQMTTADLKATVATLNKLTSLSLNPCPASWGSTTLHMTALSELCTSNIKFIQIYADSSSIFFPRDGPTSQLRAMPTIQLGCPGLSSWDVLPLCTYLSRILPDRFEFRNHFYFSLEYKDRELARQIEDTTSAMVEAIRFGERRASLKGDITHLAEGVSSLCVA